MAPSGRSSVRTGPMCNTTAGRPGEQFLHPFCRFPAGRHGAEGDAMARSQLQTTTSGFRAALAATRRLRREREAAADPGSPTAVTEVLTLRHREAMLTGAR